MPSSKRVNASDAASSEASISFLVLAFVGVASGLGLMVYQLFSCCRGVGVGVGVCLRCSCFAGDRRGMVADGGARLVMVPLSLVVCCAVSLFSVVVLLAGVDHG